MKNECSIVRDLLPLYADSLTSEETDVFITEHLAHCGECSAYLRTLEAEPAVSADPLPLKEFAKQFRKNKKETVTAVCATVTAVLLSIFAVLSRPVYLSFDDAVERTEETADSVTVFFRPGVHTYDVDTFRDPDTGETVTDITARTSAFDRMFSNSASYSAVLPKSTLWYVSDSYVRSGASASFDDTGSVLLYGSPDTHHVSLPRLTLSYYLLMAAVSSAVLFVLWLLLRKDLILKIFFLPASWTAAHIIVEGGPDGMTYSIVRDFLLIVLIAASLYVSCLTLRKRFAERIPS